MKIISFGWKCKFETKDDSSCRKVANNAIVYDLVFIDVCCCLDVFSRLLCC